MKPAKNKKYLAWIRTHECVVTENPTQVIAHHITIGALRGVSQKPTDYWAIPLDTVEHSLLHHFGEISYWRDKGRDPHLIVARFIWTWIENLGLGCEACTYFKENVKNPSEEQPYIFLARLYDKFLTEHHT